MRMTRAILPVLLVFGLCGCSKPVSSDQQAAALIREANQLLAESSKSNDWAGELGKAFNPQSRAQFPANREWLRAQSESIVKHLNEDSRLTNEAIAKYEQASGLITNEQQRKGTTSIVAALKKSVQVNDLLFAPYLAGHVTFTTNVLRGDEKVNLVFRTDILSAISADSASRR